MVDLLVNPSFQMSLTVVLYLILEISVGLFRKWRTRGLKNEIRQRIEYDWVASRMRGERVFSIDLGRMSADEARATLEIVKRRFKRRI